jgi:hypothetical protein
LFKWRDLREAGSKQGVFPGNLIFNMDRLAPHRSLVGGCAVRDAFVFSSKRKPFLIATIV